MALRLTGKVHKITQKHGEKTILNADGTRELRPWSMEIFTILTDNDLTEASFPRDYTGPKPQKGDEIDYHVRVYATSSGKYTNVNIQFLDPVGVSDPLDELLNA